MNVGAIQTDCQNHGFSDISLADFLTALNDTYQDLCSLESWPFLEKTVTGTFALTAAQFTAVTDIKQILSIVNTSQGYPLTPYNRADTFYKEYSNVLTVSGNPALYYVTGVNAAIPNGLAVAVWPIPPAQLYQLRYLYIPTMFTQVSDLPVLPERYHRILTWGTLLSLYQMEDDTEASGRYQMLYDRHLARMRDDLWSSNYDMNDAIGNVMDDSDGDYY